MRPRYSFTPIGLEPITLTDAKNFLRIDGSEDDSLVTALIPSARSTAEKFLNRLIVQTTVVATFDYFPQGGFELFYSPLQSVTSVQITDSTGSQTTWDPSNYYVDATKGNVVYTDSVVFPSSIQSTAGITITYVAGYGLLSSVSAIPPGIVEAVRQLVLAMYERENVAVLPPLIQSLLQPFTIVVV